jgi:hypothetical protein
MKPTEGRYRTATKVNVLSPEKSDMLGRADRVDLLEGRRTCIEMVRNMSHPGV